MLQSQIAVHVCNRRALWACSSGDSTKFLLLNTLIPQPLLFTSWEGVERSSLVLCTQAEKGFLQSGWCTYISEVNKGIWTKVKHGMPRNKTSAHQQGAAGELASPISAQWVWFFSVVFRPKCTFPNTSGENLISLTGALLSDRSPRDATHDPCFALLDPSWKQGALALLGLGAHRAALSPSHSPYLTSTQSGRRNRKIFWKSWPEAILNYSHQLSATLMHDVMYRINNMILREVTDALSDSTHCPISIFYVTEEFFHNQV